MKIHENLKSCNRIAKLVGNYNSIIVFAHAGVNQKFYKFAIIVYLKNNYYKIHATF